MLSLTSAEEVRISATQSVLLDNKGIKGAERRLANRDLSEIGAGINNEA